MGQDSLDAFAKFFARWEKAEDEISVAGKIVEVARMDQDGLLFQ